MEVSLQGTTDGSGNLTVYGHNHSAVADSPRLDGYRVVKVTWIDGDLTDGVDAVLSVTATSSGVDETLLTLTNANSDAIYWPRETLDDNTGVDVTFDGTRTVTVEPNVIYGKLKLAVTSGGATHTGGCIVTVEPLRV